MQNLKVLNIYLSGLNNIFSSVLCCDRQLHFYLPFYDILCDICIILHCIYNIMMQSGLLAATLINVHLFIHSIYSEQIQYILFINILQNSIKTLEKMYHVKIFLRFSQNVLDDK